VYSRKFDENLCKNIGSGLSKLQKLNLSFCPIQTDMRHIVTGCPELNELVLAGDSWVSKKVLYSIAKHPMLMFFHLGHFEHSDVDCANVVSKDPVFSAYSAKGYTVAKVFDDPSNFPKLKYLYLEKYCELTDFLVTWISKFRPSLQINFNANMSAIDSQIEEDEFDEDEDHLGEFDIGHY